MKDIYLAGGCFWGLQKYMDAITGVLYTEAGYANGNTESPTYEEVCTCNTGHAETVKVTYEPTVISLYYLLCLYFDAIDPLSINRQGADIGTQYRTGIYYTDTADLPVIKKALSELAKRLGRPLKIEVKPLKNYARSEEYHQHYLDKNPGGYCHIRPDKMRKAAMAVVDPSNYEPPPKERLKQELDPISYAVTQENATEPSFRNKYWNHYAPGIYVDITTGEPLFSSSDKYDANCGWPSFTKPIDPHVIREQKDYSHGMVRTEVRSRAGDTHLGHVFTDGPLKMGGLRYCINSAALRFIPKEDMEKEGYGYLLPYVE